MPASSTSTTERSSHLQPLRASHEAVARWAMALVLMGASWGSGSVVPVRMMLAAPNAGPAVPITPSEEHENHSSTPQVTLASASTRSRERTVESTCRRQLRAVRRQCLLEASRFLLPVCSHTDGHRLANGLMAPLRV
jgi:hypothetical protein